MPAKIGSGALTRKTIVQGSGVSMRDFNFRRNSAGTSADSTTQTAWVLATNVFLKTAQGWRLAVHHASPGAVGETPPTVGDTPALLH